MIAAILPLAVPLLAALVLPQPLPAAAAQDVKPPEVLRFSGIPDADKDKLTKQYEVVARHLSAQLGMPVEYVHVPDYNGAVTALAAGKVDLVWLGGVTAVQAEERTKGKAVFVAARATDLEFKSYFVANEALVAAGKLQPVSSLEPLPLERLAALAPALQEASFTFGAKLSTSGHIMPRHFLGQAGIDPEKAFRGKPGYQLQGGHSATLQAVASGAFDVGVLNYTSWEAADEATKRRAPVVYVTPEYVDYCMVASARLGDDLLARLRRAFTSLDAKDPAHAPVLAAFSAERFVPADPKAWDGIRKVLADAKASGVLE